MDSGAGLGLGPLGVLGLRLTFGLGPQHALPWGGIWTPDGALSPSSPSGWPGSRNPRESRSSGKAPVSPIWGLRTDTEPLPVISNKNAHNSNY